MISIDDAIDDLRKLKRDGKLIIFVGSGMSVPKPTDLPTWDGFLKSFIEFCRDMAKKHDIEITDDLLIDAEKASSKYPIEVASVLRNKLLQVPKRIKEDINDEFKTWFILFFGNRKPNQYHEKIIRTEVPYILTSNYDILLEKAAQSNKKTFTSVSFHKSADLAEIIYTEQPAIIHLHGKYTDILMDKIILTQEDYFRIIKKEYPGFTFAMHTILMRYSTLFLGYGASDPHLEDLIEEMSTYFHYQKDYNLPRNYLVLKKNKVNLIKDEYKRKIGTEIIAINSYKEYDSLLDQLID